MPNNPPPIPATATVPKETREADATWADGLASILDLPVEYEIIARLAALSRGAAAVQSIQHNEPEWWDGDAHHRECASMDFLHLFEEGSVRPPCDCRVPEYLAAVRAMLQGPDA